MCRTWRDTRMRANRRFTLRRTKTRRFCAKRCRAPDINGIGSDDWAQLSWNVAKRAEACNGFYAAWGRCGTGQAEQMEYYVVSAGRRTEFRGSRKKSEEYVLHHGKKDGKGRRRGCDPKSRGRRGMHVHCDVCRADEAGGLSHLVLSGAKRGGRRDCRGDDPQGRAEVSGRGIRLDFAIHAGTEVIVFRLRARKQGKGNV